MPNFIDSVTNAFDFARTASILYAEGNPDVLQAANMLFGSGFENQAIGTLSVCHHISLRI